MDNIPNINWFPGHMTKAKRALEKQLEQCDVVIELRDARAVNSTENPLLKKLFTNKPTLIILAKSDLAEDHITQKWLDYYKKQGVMAVKMDILKDNVVNIIERNVNILMQTNFERLKRRGIRPRATRALIVGIPNVGKSTLINRLTKRKVAQTANKAGLTRALKLVKVSDKLEVIDSPGMLWPKFDDKKIGVHLALIGAINEDILPFESLVEQSYYKIKDSFDLQFSNSKELIYEYGKKYNLLVNGEVDEFEASKLLLRNLRNGKIKKVSWESPND